MILYKSKIYSKLLYLVGFLNFLGFYALLALIINLGAQDMSRELTIPLRIIIVGLLGVIFLLSRKGNFSRHLRLFLLFSGIYIGRIFLEYINNEHYYISHGEVLVYFFSFSFFPFMLIGATKINSERYNVILKAIMFSGLWFGILTFLFYREFIGSVGRLTATTADNEVMSPLLLSYCATLAIGVSVGHWLEINSSFRQRAYLFCIIAFSAVSFFLGASRGSVIALLLPFLIMFLVKRGVGEHSKLFLILGVAVISLIYFSDQLGSSLIARFTGIASDVESGSGSAIRTEIWKQALSQFIDHPIFGDGLRVIGFDVYPHNLFIETLLTTGIVGFIPFILLIIAALRKSVYVFRKAPEYSWLGIVFMQSLVQGMFSGALYTASWLWLSMALMFAFQTNFNQNVK